MTELQNVLDALMEWSEKWCMAFNVQKCKVMHVGWSNSKAAYKMGRQLLEETAEESGIPLQGQNYCSEALQTVPVC